MCVCACVVGWIVMGCIVLDEESHFDKVTGLIVSIRCRALSLFPSTPRPHHPATNHHPPPTNIQPTTNFPFPHDDQNKTPTPAPNTPHIKKPYTFPPPRFPNISFHFPSTPTCLPHIPHRLIPQDCLPRLDLLYISAVWDLVITTQHP